MRLREATFILFPGIAYLIVGFSFGFQYGLFGTLAGMIIASKFPTAKSRSTKYREAVNALPDFNSLEAALHNVPIFSPRWLSINSMVTNNHLLTLRSIQAYYEI